MKDLCFIQISPCGCHHGKHRIQNFGSCLFKPSGNARAHFKLDKLFKNGQNKFVKDSLFLSRPYPFNFFKGCLRQIFLGPFLNTLSQTYLTCTLNISQGSIFLRNHFNYENSFKYSVLYYYIGNFSFIIFISFYSKCYLSFFRTGVRLYIH